MASLNSNYISVTPGVLILQRLLDDRMLSGSTLSFLTTRLIAVQHWHQMYSNKAISPLTLKRSFLEKFAETHNQVPLTIMEKFQGR